MKPFTKRFMVFALLMFTVNCLNTLSATNYTSNGTGLWTSPGSWTPSGVPVAGDNVTIGAHTITLSADAACNNLTFTTPSTNRLALLGFTLQVSGTLAHTVAPSSDNYITSSAGVGRIKFIGSSRVLITTGAAFGNGFDLEVALDGGETGTSTTNLKNRNVYITSGTFDMGTGQYRIDGGTGLNGAGTLTVSSGATLKCNRAGERTGTAGTYCGSVTIDGTLELNGSVLNGLTITVNGTLRLKSTTLLVSFPNTASDPEFVYGTSGILEYNSTAESTMGPEVDRASATANPTVSTLRVNCTTGVQTGGKIPRINTLDFLLGKVRCNGSNVVIVTGGSVTGESATKYVVTASITAALVREGMGFGEFPVGTANKYLPITALSNAGTPDNFTVFTTELTASCLAAASSTAATWNISEAVAGGSSCSLTLDYGTSVQGGAFNSADASIAHCNGVTVDYRNGTPSGGTEVTGDGFTSFSPFGITSDLALPLELKDFSGKVFDHYNQLYWTTASERNVAWHIVERSPDGFTDWQSIGKIPSRGDAQFDQNYIFNDNAPPAKGYYRLHSADIDGRSKISHVLALTRNQEIFSILNIFPSPASDLITLQINNPEEGDIDIQVTDIAGRVVIRQSASTVKGVNIIPVQVGRLSAGNYNITVISNNTITEPKRFVKG